MPRKKRRREDAPAVESTSPHHPFPTEYGDHFETPLQAYRDIEGALALLSKLLGKKRKHLRIWDPYVSPETKHHTAHNAGRNYTSVKLALVNVHHAHRHPYPLSCGLARLEPIAA